MESVRLGIIGLGSMGTNHARSFRRRKIRRAQLAAVCNRGPAALQKVGDHVAKFGESGELIRSGKVDAVLIATPHPSHADIAIDALENGLHVLVEKPLCTHVADAERVLDTHRKTEVVFASMFNQRTDPRYRRVRELVAGGEVGPLLRAHWTATAWYRPEAYYQHPWRGTWAGEGGALMLSQCCHQLDLLQWICGMPSRATGFCMLGKAHRIEAEDEITAYLEYDGGANAVFVASTCEAPGTNRLEIAGERGKVVVEDSRVVFARNRVPTGQFKDTAVKEFAKPALKVHKWRMRRRGGQHNGILQNFVDAILDGVPLIAPASEAVHSLELGNAILQSSLTRRTVDLPLDREAFARTLQGLVEGGRA